MKRLLTVIAGLVVLGVLGSSPWPRRPAIALISPPEASRRTLLPKAKPCPVTAFARYATRPKAGRHTPAATRCRTSALSTRPTSRLTRRPASDMVGGSVHAGDARRGGARWFPPLPAFRLIDHFTKLSDNDVKALYAYFMTRPPFRSPAKGNTIPFPLNIRYLQAGWKLLFFRPGRYDGPMPQRAPNGTAAPTSRSGFQPIAAPATTPRKPGRRRKGRRHLCRRIVDNWIAPALTAENPSPAPWTPGAAAKLFAHLGFSVLAWEVASGTRCPPVPHGLSALPESDGRAIATYFAERRPCQGRSLGVHRCGGGAGNVPCGSRRGARFSTRARASTWLRLRVLPP